MMYASFRVPYGVCISAQTMKKTIVTKNATGKDANRIPINVRRSLAFWNWDMDSTIIPIFTQNELQRWSWRDSNESPTRENREKDTPNPKLEIMRIVAKLGLLSKSPGDASNG